jgi:hypothetical protein
MKKPILALGTILLSVFSVNAQDLKTGVVTEELNTSDYRIILSGHSNGWAIEEGSLPENPMNVYIIRDETTGGVCVSLPTNTKFTVGENVGYEEKVKGTGSTGSSSSDWITNTCAIRMSR